MKTGNFVDIKNYVNNCLDHLKTLTDAAGKKTIDGPRKAFIIGFGTSAQSIFAISERLLSRNNYAVEYILTYRFSQDPWKCSLARFEAEMDGITIQILSN